ncbi:MAG: hypothetical protein FJW88_03240 [Actinobacteria bacterium]|nr:hypothetical protein [Actinomycetota bacterium]
MSAAKKPPAQRPAQKFSFPLFWVVVGGIVVLGLVAVVFAVTSGDDGSDSSGGGGSSGVAEYGTVTVEGTPLPTYSSSGEDPAVGEQAPVVRGESFTGEPTAIVPGTPTMVVYLAHWCQHCNNEAPRLAEFLETSGVPEGTALMIVPTGSNDTAVNWPPSQWVKDMRLDGVATLVDDKEGTAGAAMGLDGYPYIVLLDAQGKVISRTSGEQADGYFAEAFDRLKGSAAG